MEQDWIVAAQQGDQHAITQLVDTYQRSVYARCYRLLGNATDAEDAAQEAMVKAIMNLHTFDVSRPMRPWLLRIASNLCMDRLRRQKPVISLDGMGDDGAWEWKAGTAISPEKHLEQKEQEEQVRALLGTLPEVDQRLVSLFYWEGLSYIEIAEATEMSVSAVKSRLFRARRAMAQSLIKEEVYA